jgi:L-fuculose-phosphate aldolase
LNKRLKIEKIKRDIVEVAKIMYDKGMVNAYEGNISVRDGDTVYITPSAKCKGFLTPEMIISTKAGVPADNARAMPPDPRCADLKPSSELKLHLAVYEQRDDLRAVIHSHSPYATAYAIANKPIATKAYPEMITFFGQIPLLKYGTPSTDAVFAELHKYIHDFDVFLLANHGIVSVGFDIWDTYFRMEAAEGIAKTLLLAEQAGGAVDLPDDEIKRLI